jgi:uncharacterized protein (TIGR02001 family)
MRKSVLSAAVATAFAVPTLVAAQTPAPAPTPAVTGNISIVSDYRFRGITQTFEKPAIQGGIDYANAQNGLYLGNWNSNVSQGAGFPGGNIEMDFYGGWKKAFGDLGLDVGFIYYYYPGTDSAPGLVGAPTNNRTGAVASGKVDNKEIYIGGTWKFLSLKFFDSIDDYFAVPGTKNTYYLDLSGNYDLGSGWGVVGHIGHLNLKDVNDGSYTDWKLGVTKDLSGWVLGATYVDTNAKGDCGSGQFYCFLNTSGTETKNAGKSTVVLSVSKTF